jgi:hypothetical protein
MPDSTESSVLPCEDCGSSEPSIEDLKVFVSAMLSLVAGRFGERASAVFMIGVPVAGGHDRFAAHAIGPCLSARGLLDWGSKETARIIAAFRNPNDPPVANGKGTGGTVIIAAGDIGGVGGIRADSNIVTLASGKLNPGG